MRQAGTGTIEDVHQHAQRLQTTVKSLHWGISRGYSQLGIFGRNLDELLKWRAGWVNRDFNETKEQALKGCCSEVSRPRVCLPWTPKSPYEWHPDLSAALSERAHQMGTFDQKRIDEQLILATALQILVEWGIHVLPKGDKEQVRRKRIIEDLRAEIERRIEDTVPFRMQEYAFTRHRKAVSAAEREELTEQLTAPPGASQAPPQPFTPATPHATSSSSASASASSTMPISAPQWGWQEWGPSSSSSGWQQPGQGGRRTGGWRR